MSASLRLLITDYQSPNEFRWQLEGPNGNVLADKNVRLDTTQLEYQGYADLPAFLQHYRISHTQPEMLEMVGDWIGKHVFGNILSAIVNNESSPLTTVAVVMPNGAQALLERPLELARLKGLTLTEQNIRMVYEREDVTALTPKASADSLRVLAVFSLPDGNAPLNLRQERYELEKFVHRLQAQGKAVDLQVLQYGATRDTLKDALDDGDGWDILHFSGHGLNGVLILEKPDGKMDVITAADLQRILKPTRGRVSLVFLSACLSGAATLQEARRALGLALPHSDTDAPTAQATLLPSLGQELAEQLDTAVVAMRYRVGDRFAADLGNTLYNALLTKTQSLPRALHTAIEAACTAKVAAAMPLSRVTPILFGRRAADLKLTLGPRPHEFDLPLVGKDAFPQEPARFVGRLQPMRLGQETLAPAGDKRGILYYGMAGAGKTTIATELSYRYDEKRFRRFVWHRCPEQDSDIGGAFAAFLNALYNQLELTDTRLLANADRPDEFNRSTLPLLRQYLRENSCLIVLDNLEGLLKPDNNWRDPVWGPLLDTQSQSRVVLTSRYIPNSLADLPQLERCPVHALSLGEAHLLARELPHLAGLFDDPEGQSLLQWTLRLVQGHPKLLEFANGIAADRAELKAQLLNAESATEGSASLQAFFETGETARQEPEFLEAFGFWTRSLTAQLSSFARLLFSYLACLEEADRASSTLSETWFDFLAALPDDLPEVTTIRSDSSHTLITGLRELTEPGLIEAQALSQPKDAPANALPSFRYILHPAVAETTRQSANPAIRVAADQTLASLYIGLVHYFRERETEGHSSNLVVAAKRALPYLMRQQNWEWVATMVEDIEHRDQSPATLALILPLLERAIEAEIKVGDKGTAAGILARSLMRMGRTEEAEERLKRLIEQSVAQENYRTALVAAGELTNLLGTMGRYDEALALVEGESEYTRQAGMGPWTQLLKETKRLQIGNAMGRWEATLNEGKVLRKRMEGLSEVTASGQSESTTPYHVREVLLDTLHNAAFYTEDYMQALELNATVLKSLVKRNAEPLQIARNLYDKCGSLLHLHRYDEVREPLKFCWDVFTRVGNDIDLGNVYSALADLEYALGNVGESIVFERQALLYKYRAARPDVCSISHNNMANRHEHLVQLTEERANRLASAIIFLQLKSGQLQTLVQNLARGDVSAAPPKFDWVADKVEQIPGVRFRELFARLPLTVPDGDVAIVAVWEMARQEQARMASQQAIVADLPPAVRAAVEAENEEAFKAAMEQLPEEEAQMVLQSLTETGIIGKKDNL